jgi:hypothetical protein
MAMSQLVANETPFSVSTRFLVLSCNLFESNAYHIRSGVSTSSFQLFLSALEGESVTINESKQADLTFLGNEFEYSSFSNQFA